MGDLFEEAFEFYINWPILAKCLDVRDISSNYHPHFASLLQSADKYCFKLRAVCGWIASPGCLLCSLSRTGERTSGCHYRAERGPRGHLGYVVGGGALNANSFPLSTLALLSIRRLRSVYVGRGRLHGRRVPDASACFGSYLSQILHLYMVYGLEGTWRRVGHQRNQWLTAKR